MAERNVRIRSDDVVLTGSIWSPTGPPKAGIVMHPGSGPSDRNNDGYFVTLRNALVDAGYAVSSYDKRGVGGSTGHWQQASIEAQARDLAAAADRLASSSGMRGVPIGVFGHSQGGWVALDTAAIRADTAFVILNSGPGVSPSVQERYSARTALERAGADPETVERGVAHYDLVTRLARARTPWEQVRDRKDELAPYLPEDASQWRFWISILDHEPRRVLYDIHVPILTLWGEDDPLVPVEDSIAVFRREVPPHRLTVEVFPHADHRILVDGELAPGYIEAVLTFLESHSQS